MADPRFYDNCGPFCLSELCRSAQIEGDWTSASELVCDVAALDCAGPAHITFCDTRRNAGSVATSAGWCIALDRAQVTAPTVMLPSARPLAAFAAVARMFYPAHDAGFYTQDAPIHRSARLGVGVVVASGVVIGPGAEIGDGTRIGPNAVIGRGVAVGRRCEIGAHAVIGFAFLGDDVVIQPGVVIGASGFGFSSGPQGHSKIPQLGRVMVQDRVEIGANSTVDRAALGDTVIGEGSKIDNLVQIGHNTRIGRNCVIAGQVGISGSVTLGDFVALGGMAGIADHVTIGDGARLAGLAGVAHDLPGGRDYGGIPARPIREWHRQTAYLSRMTRRTTRTGND